MKIVLLYKGYMPINDLDTIYRNPLEDTFPNLVFDVVNLKLQKPKATEMREWADLAKPTLEKYDYVLIADSAWFKTLTKNKKSETTLGMAQNSPNFNSKVFYVPSQYVYQVDSGKTLEQLSQAIKGIQLDSQGKSSIIEPEIHSEVYPTNLGDIQNELGKLLDKPVLYCDIEAKSLNVTEAGIYTIGFAWDKHNGIAFPVDASPYWSSIREVLKQFFMNYKGKLVFHKANYDVAVIIYTLFQKELTNIQGQLDGIKTFFKKDGIDDTLIITYLATNSCSGNILGLKELAQPYAGDWAVDVKDVTKVDLSTLLKYQLVDCLSTAYVHQTYYPKMVEDGQEELYHSFMLPTLKTNIRCQLNGLPIDTHLVQEFNHKLSQEEQLLKDSLYATKSVKNAEEYIAELRTVKRNQKLKKKVTTVQENLKPLNFNSNDDLAVLLHDVMQLPIIEHTKSGKPSTGKDTIKDLKHYTNHQEYIDILTWLSDLADVEKIKSAFIPAFTNAPTCLTGNRLLGYFNLGGTVSGRLSSSNVNLQQLPSTGSRFAKPVKKLFTSNGEWLFVGLDYNSLEDRISALTTKDPNKLAVYLYGYDGHCLRSHFYFGNHMPSLNEQLSALEVNSSEYVKIINSIDGHYEYGGYRQESKAPTFALTYKGTYLTLMKNCGFSEEKAKQIEEAYHKMYAVSDEWVNNKIKQACIDGYITTGFGLKVRTPLLKQVGYENINKNRLASAEMRTASNALGQGWGVLNDRAMNEVMNQVDKLGLSNDILPIAKIHDATYYLVRNNSHIVTTLNRLAIEQAYWNNHPDIYHPEVGLGGQLDIFFPDWANPLTLPEDCSEEQLIELCTKHIEKLNE